MFENFSPMQMHWMMKTAAKFEMAYLAKTDAFIPYADLKELFEGVDENDNFAANQSDDFPELIGADDGEHLPIPQMPFLPIATVHVKNSLKYVTADDFDELEQKLEDLDVIWHPAGSVRFIKDKIVQPITVMQETIGAP